MHEGRISGEVAADGADEELLLAYCYGKADIMTMSDGADAHRAISPARPIAEAPGAGRHHRSPCSLLIVFFFAMRPDVVPDLHERPQHPVSRSRSWRSSPARRRSSWSSATSTSRSPRPPASPARSPHRSCSAARRWRSRSSSALAVGLARSDSSTACSIAYLNLSAFVATLATMTSVIGLAYLVTRGHDAVQPAGRVQRRSARAGSSTCRCRCTSRS